MLHQLVYGNVPFVNESDAAIDHFSQVVRHHVGRHADCNTAGSIDK